MASYSGVIVFFLLVPVLMQIVLPLAMLAGYGLGQIVKVLLKRQKSRAAAAGDVHVAEKMAANI